MERKRPRQRGTEINRDGNETEGAETVRRRRDTQRSWGPLKTDRKAERMRDRQMDRG